MAPAVKPVYRRVSAALNDQYIILCIIYIYIYISDERMNKYILIVSSIDARSKKIKRFSAKSVSLYVRFGE